MSVLVVSCRVVSCRVVAEIEIEKGVEAVEDFWAGGCLQVALLSSNLKVGGCCS